MQVRTVPPRDVLQSSPETRSKWVSYCVADVQATHELYGFLQSELKKVPWTTVDTDTGFKILSMFDLYSQIWPLVDNLYGNIKGSAKLAKRFGYLDTCPFIPATASHSTKRFLTFLLKAKALQPESQSCTRQGNVLADG